MVTCAHYIYIYIYAMYFISFHFYTSFCYDSHFFLIISEYFRKSVKMVSFTEKFFFKKKLFIY